MEIYYFSGTGNSLYIAKKIKESFKDCNLIPIEKDNEKLKQVEIDIIPVIEDIKKRINRKLSNNYFQIFQYNF